MRAHELAAYLLTLPDLPVYINGWGSDEGVDCEVTKSFIREDRIDLDYEELNWGSKE